MIHFPGRNKPLLHIWLPKVPRTTNNTGTSTTNNLATVPDLGTTQPGSLSASDTPDTASTTSMLSVEEAAEHLRVAHKCQQIGRRITRGWRRKKERADRKAAQAAQEMGVDAVQVI